MATILLIEDNKDILENTAEILELAGYKVLMAENGKIGVTLAIEHIPALIVCDIMMPVLDGYGVIHMLQKNTQTQNIPFIFLTAKAERNEIRKGMDLGADDYITKPFDGTELLNAIESRLRKSELLKQLPAGLNGLDTLISTVSGKEALKHFTENRSTSNYKKKKTIYTEGNHPTRLFYIQKGKIKTYKVNDDGKEFIIGLFKEGDFLGYTALLEGGLYKESAETLEDCELAIIPKDEFDELINSNREVLHKFVHLLTNNITEKEEQLLQLAYSSLRKKVADTLIMLSKKYKTEKDKQFAINITRGNLANIAGTAKESLIRTLSDFKDEQLIDIVHGDIVLLDEKKLQKMFN